MSLRSLSVILRVKEESVVTMEGCKKELRDIFTLSGRQLTTGETGVLYTRGGWSCVEKGRVKWEAKMWGWESVKDAFGECDDAE